MGFLAERFWCIRGSGMLMRSGVPQSCGSRESHRPFGFPRPATATTATPKRELLLANTVGEFDAGERNGRIVERLEASHRGAVPLDRAVVLLDDVVEILVRVNFDVSPTRTFALQQPQRSPTRHVAIQCHLARSARKSRRERFAEERLCGGDATVTAKQEVSHLGETPPALLEFRNVAGHPPKHGRMGHLDAALGHHFDQVPVRQPR